MKTRGRYAWIAVLGFAGHAGCNAKLLVEGRSAVDGADASAEAGTVGPPSTGAGGANVSTGGARTNPPPDETGGQGGTVGSGGAGGASAGAGGSTGGAENGGSPPDASVGGSGPFQCVRSPFTDTPPRWTGNAATCPATHPVEFADCTDKGRICEYVRDENTYMSFICFEKDLTHAVWHRQEGASARSDGCPVTQPLDGSPCSAPPDLLYCDYPNRELCECKGPATDDGGVPDGQWRCSVPEGAAWSGRPTTVDEGKRVGDLTATERRRWCEWFSCLPAQYQSFSSTPPADLPVSNGHVHTGSCYSAVGIFGNLYYLTNRPSIEQCEANLSFSTCRATVRQLDDCALMTSNWSFGSLPFGCGPYLDSEGCAGTIFGAFPVDPDGGPIFPEPREGGAPDDTSGCDFMRVK